MDKGLRWLMFGAFVWLLVLVGVVVRYRQVGQVRLEVVSEMSNLGIEMVDESKFREVLRKMGMGKLMKVRWEFTGELQDKVQVLGVDQRPAYSMGFKYGWFGQRLTIKMQYSEEWLGEQGQELERTLTRDMLVYVYMIKMDGWQKGKLVQGLREAMNWVSPRLLGYNWLEVRMNTNEN